MVTNSNDVRKSFAFLIMKKMLLFSVDVADKLPCSIQQRNKLELLRHRLYLKLISIKSTSLNEKEDKEFFEFAMDGRDDALRIIGGCVTKEEYEEKYKLVELQYLSDYCIILKCMKSGFVNSKDPNIKNHLLKFICATENLINNLTKEFKKDVVDWVQQKTLSDEIKATVFVTEVRNMVNYRESQIAKVENNEIDDIQKFQTHLVFSDLYKNKKI